jgi:hypothetical protein
MKSFAVALIASLHRYLLPDRYQNQRVLQLLDELGRMRIAAALLQSVPAHWMAAVQQIDDEIGVETESFINKLARIGGRRRVGRRSVAEQVLAAQGVDCGPERVGVERLRLDRLPSRTSTLLSLW